MPRVQYPFPVSTVEQCPRNRTSWNMSSTSRRCPIDVNGRSTYHCVPNQKTSDLLEFCYIRPIGRYQNGTCLYLTNSGYLNQVNCTDFTHGCPKSTYLSNEIYKYQECLVINKKIHCYEAAWTCQNRTRNGTNVSSPIPPTSVNYIPVLLSGLIPVIFMILFFALFMIIRRKNNSKNGDNNDPERQNLLQNDNPKKMFKETRAYQKAREVLFQKKYVFIKGNPGDGKTTIAKHLLKELKNNPNKRMEIVMTLKELCEKREQIKNTVFFIDNIFGEYVFRNSEIDQWETKTNFMENVLSDEIDKKGNFLIVTIRNDMYSEIQTQLHFKMEFISNALVDISDAANSLTKEEMKDIYNLYVDKTFRTDAFYNAFPCGPPFGFPQSCKLFGNNKILQKRGPNFFKNPSESLSQYVENIYWHCKPQFSVFVYILMKEDRVSMSSLRNPNFDTEIKRKAMDVHPENQNLPMISAFTKCINGLMGSFLVEENGLCSFSHSCIQNVIKNVLIKYDLSFVIQYCHISLLANLYVEDTSEKTKNLQTIDQSFFAQILKKIIANLKCSKKSELFKIICNLKFWKHKAFCTEFNHFVDQEQSILTVLDENGASLLIHFAEAGQIEMVKLFLKVITHDKQRYDALNQATLMNHINVVRILLDEGVNPDAKSCFCAIQNGNLDIVKQFITSGLDLLEFSESRHPMFLQQSLSILAESCVWERLGLISFLLGICPALSNIKKECGDSTIHFVAFAGATDALKVLINDHKCDPYLKTNEGGSILHCACQNGKLETAKYIISQYPALLNKEHDLCGDHSILHIVALGGNVELFQMLKKQNVTVSPQKGETVLHSACFKGRLEMSKFLLKSFPHLLTVKNFIGINALHACAWGGNIELLKYLLETKIDINEKPNNEKTLLHLCCMNGKIDMCKYLVNTYPHLLHVTDNDGMNALHDAASSYNVDLVMFLLEKDLNIKSTTKDGRTVLHMCCMNGKVEMCRYLVNSDPDLLNVKDKEGMSVLHYAACNGNVDLFVFLLEKGLDIKSITNDVRTVLHMCCINGKIDMCKYLVNTYPDLLNVKDNNGMNVLHYAACNGNVDLFVFLLEKGFDIKSTRNDGKTVLHLCCYNGQIDLCRYLLKTYPFLLNITDENGMNSLHDSACSDNVDLIMFLSEKGLDFKSITNDGGTVLHICCLNGKIAICKSLVNTYPDLLNVKDKEGMNVLHYAACNGNVDLFVFLLKKGLDIKSTRNDGKNVLHLCCRNGKIDMCKYLVNTYPDLLNMIDNEENYVLHDAAWNGNVYLVKLLLEKGLDIKSTKNDGKTVLHLCCRNGKIDLCKYLVSSYPFLLDDTDKDGENALHDAAWGGNVDLVMFLLEKGLDIRSTRNDGKTVLHLCCKNGNIDMVKYIVATYPFLINVKDNNGHNVLHDACIGGSYDTFLFIFNNTIDVKNEILEDGKTLLHCFCILDDIAFCKYLVNTYPFLLDVTDINGENALHAAAYSGNNDLVKLLSEKGLDITSSRNDGKTLLHLCCMNSKADMCKYLVNTYPFLLNAIDDYGFNALHYAAGSGNIDLLKFLLEKGVDIKSTRHNGANVLSTCCTTGKIDMCKYLVNTYPYLLNVIDHNGLNVLHNAICSGNIDLVLFLIEKGLDIKSTCNVGKNVFHLCCMSGNIDMCKYLVTSYPSLLNDTDNDGENALHDATLSGNVDLLVYLLEKGFNIKSTTRNGKTVLHQCCRNGEIDMCKYLINIYPDLLNITDNDGYTILHDASWSGNVDLVKFLVEKDFDIKSTTNEKESVLHLCCRNGKIDMCKYLVSKYPSLLQVCDNEGNNVLHEAAKSGNLDLVKFLIEKGLDIKSTRHDGKTLLHLCSYEGYISMCKYLINRYPELSCVTDNGGFDVLDVAVGVGNVDLVMFLKGKGIKIKSTRNDGTTFLDLCCMNGKLAMCKYLLNIYPDLLNVKNERDWDVLHFAAWSGNVNLAVFLLEQGLDIKSITNDGKNVLHVCCRNGKIDMCIYLVNTYPYLLNVIDNNGMNALHDAACSGNVDLVLFLLKKGLDIKSTCNVGRNIIHFCCMYGKVDMCKYMVTSYPSLLNETDNDGENALHDAALSGNVDLLVYLLEKGFNIKSTTRNGKTVLHQCCRNGKIDMCKYLINIYPDLLNITDNDGYSILHDASWSGNVDLVKFLVEKDFDIKSTTNEKESVLHLCCRNGKIDMCKYLVSKYPSLLQVCDNEGNNVLHEAAKSGNLDLVKFLIEKGLDIKSTRHDGKTLLHLCSYIGYISMCKYLINRYPELSCVTDNEGLDVFDVAVGVGNVDLVMFLKGKGIKIKSTRNNGTTFLHLCCMNGKIAMCKYLVNIYPDLLNVKDKEGKNVLHYAAWSGNVNLVVFLLEKGLDIKSTTNDGQTVLYVCCYNGKIDLCKYLVNTYPFLLDVTDIYGENALHAAAYSGNVDVVKFLLEKGLDIISTRNDGRTLLHLCCENSKVDMCKYLVSTYPYLLNVADNYGMNVLHVAAWGGNIDLIMFLLENDLDNIRITHLCCKNGKIDMCKYLDNTYPYLLYATDNFSMNILNVAFMLGNVDLAMLLLEKDLYLKTMKNGGQTMLHMCCRNGKIDMCKYLVSKYPYLLKVTDNKGNNALHVAARSGNIVLVKFLLEKGLDIKSTRCDGKTLLHLSCMSGKIDMCKYLVNTYPYLINVTDKAGENVLHDAVWSGAVDLVIFLLEKGLDIKSTTDDGETVLHQCCRSGRVHMYKYLVNTCPDLVDVKDNDGKKAFHHRLLTRKSNLQL